jgi:hypothetical protein
LFAHVTATRPTRGHGKVGQLRFWARTKPLKLTS